MKTQFKQVDGAYNWYVVFDDGTEMLLDEYYASQEAPPDGTEITWSE